MKLGMIGLGRMGANMAERLVLAGHSVSGFDRSAGAMAAAQKTGVESADTLEKLVESLEAPRVVWIMVPAGDPVDVTIGALKPLLSEGDIVIDGGNSFYGDTERRAATLAAHGIRMLDVGTSGGVWGLTEGYSLMIGGDPATVTTARNWAERCGLDPTLVLAADNLTAVTIPRHILSSPEGHTLFVHTGGMSRDEIVQVIDERVAGYERWAATGERADWMR